MDEGLIRFEYNSMQPVRGQIRTSYLACSVCEQAPDQPKMCPRCGRAFCGTCLLANFHSIREECPSCHHKVPQQDFIQSNTVLAMTSHIAERVKRQFRRAEQREQCLEHSMPLSYFCVECNIPLCADCGLLTDKHTGHRFISYRDIYERIKKKVFDEFPKFDRKIEGLVESKMKARLTLQSLQDNYKRYKKCFEESYITYTQRVETNAKQVEENIGMRAQNNRRRLGQLEHLRQNIYQQIEKKTQLSLIKQTNTLVESIRALSEQEPSGIELEKEDEKEDLADLVPAYVTWQYRMEKFTEKAGIVYSEPKKINGVEWRLKIYPRGNGLARQKYLSVFVEMTHAFTSQNRYEYRIELLNPIDPTMSVRREYCSTFEVGQCWGYNQFEQLEQLELKEFLQDDSLLFEIGVRNRTYRSLVDDQILYIEVLKREIQERDQRQKVQQSQIIKKKKSGQTTLKKVKSKQKKEPQKIEKQKSESQDPANSPRIVASGSGKDLFDIGLDRLQSKKEIQQVQQDQIVEHEKKEEKKESKREEIPFQLTQTYELIQEFLKRQQSS